MPLPAREGRQYDYDEWLRFECGGIDPSETAVELKEKFDERLVEVVGSYLRSQVGPDPSKYAYDEDAMSWKAYASIVGHGVGLWEADGDTKLPEEMEEDLDKIVKKDEVLSKLAWKIDEECQAAKAGTSEADEARKRRRLQPGYAYSAKVKIDTYGRAQRWASLPDDAWETIILDRDDIVGTDYVGTRVIDGAPVAVFGTTRPTLFYAQTLAFTAGETPQGGEAEIVKAGAREAAGEEHGLVLEFPTADAARDFFEGYVGRAKLEHRVVTVLDATDHPRAIELAKKHRGRVAESREGGEPLHAEEAGKPTKEAIDFFYKHAGWGFDPKKETEEEGRLRGARSLARAEMVASARGWRVEWKHDPEPWDPGDTGYVPKEVLVAVLYDENGEVKASLGGIADPTRAYARVVEAELADEALFASVRARAARGPKAGEQVRVSGRPIGSRDDALVHARREGATHIEAVRFYDKRREGFDAYRPGPKGKQLVDRYFTDSSGLWYISDMTMFASGIPTKAKKIPRAQEGASRQVGRPLQANDYPDLESALLGAQSKWDASHVLKTGSQIAIFSPTSRGYVKRVLFKQGGNLHWPERSELVSDLPKGAISIHEATKLGWDPDEALPRAKPVQRAAEERETVPAEDAVPWVKVTRDPERYAEGMKRAKEIGPIDSAREVYELLSPALAKEDQEVFLVVLLDVKQQCRGVAETHRGERSRVPVAISDVLRSAIATGAESIVVVHNHPTTDPTPSKADRELTESIRKASDAVGIKFVDHVVIGIGKYYSFAEGKVRSVRERGKS